MRYWTILVFMCVYKDKVKAQSNVESLNKSIASYTTFYDRVLAKTEELSKECKNGDTGAARK